MRTPALLLLAAALLCALPLAAARGAADPAPAPGANRTRIDAILARLGAATHFRSVALSPDARQLAWVLDTPDGEHLQLADGDGSHVRAVAVAGLHRGCSETDPAWSPDGRTLAFLANCADAGDAQNDIYLLDTSVAGIQPHRLTHLKGLVHALRWAPDGKALGFLYVPGDTHRVDALAATGPRVGVIGEAGVEYQRVALAQADTGAVSLLSPMALFPYEFTFAPDGKRIAYVAAPPPGDNNWWVAQLYVQDATPGARPRSVVDPQTVTGPLHGLQIALPRFSPDGQSIAFIGGLMSDQGVTGGDIYLVASSGGAPVDITPGIHVTPGWLVWTGPRSLLVNAFAGGSSRIDAFTLTGPAHGHVRAEAHTLATVHAALGDGTAMSALSLARDGRALAFIRSTFTEPPEIWSGALAHDAAGTVTRIDGLHAVTRINAGLQPLWGQAESVHWTSEDFRVQGWLLYPAHYDPHRRYPLIVAVHGGPSYAVQPRWPGASYGGAPLSAMGYFVLFPNPRGSFGQGERFTQANRRDFGYGDLRDILAGVRAVEARWPVDPQRIGITGWSYGGFMSMFAPTQTRVFRAAVAGAGLSDWLSYTGENSIDQWMKPFFGATVYDDPAVYARSSAINFIKRDKTPTLLLVGQYDAECPAPQSFEFWHGLKAMGVPTRLVVYPDEGHGFVDPAHKRDVLARALDWFARYLPASH